MKEEYGIRLVKKELLGETCAVLTFFCPEIALSAKPGQFVNLSCSYFLKRPFGIMSVDREEKTFSIGVRKVGKGTEQIIKANEGDTFTVLGPLGNGFDFSNVKKLLLVGGGTGIFPIFFAAQYAKENNIPCGVKGNVMAYLETMDDSELSDSTVMVVGPGIMMRKVSEWAKAKGLTCYVSLEQRMACGIGACLVCICKIKAEQEGKEFVHKRCCKDGPVFNAEEVIW